MPSFPQFSFALPAATAMGAETFALSQSNRQAWEQVQQWPEWPQPVLVLQGPPAAGKTHLAHIWAAQSGARFIDPQSLGREAVQLLVEADEASAAWVIDGLEHVSDETALFHLMNAVREAGGWLLLTTTTPPGQMTIALADVRSRLCAAPLAPLHAPDDAVLAAVLAKQFADRQLRVGDDVIQYLLKRMDRSFAAARNWVQRLDEAALANHDRISIRLARRLMDEEEEQRRPPLL